MNLIRTVDFDRVLQCDVTNISICEIIGFDEIFEMSFPNLNELVDSINIPSKPIISQI